MEAVINEFQYVVLNFTEKTGGGVEFHGRGEKGRSDISNRQKIGRRPTAKWKHSICMEHLAFIVPASKQANQ